MFNLKINKVKGAYYFTITRPDKSEMTGQRNALFEVYEELSDHIAAFERQTCDCCWPDAFTD